MNTDPEIAQRYEEFSARLKVFMEEAREATFTDVQALFIFEKLEEKLNRFNLT